MNHHAGMIKNRNGIEYNINNIPDCVTLYPYWSDEIEPSKHALDCISDELLQTDTVLSNSKLTYKHIFNITPTTGMPPITLREPYTYRAFYNCKHSGLFHFRHINTQKKYTFTVDKNMLLLVHDPENVYVVGCPYSTSDELNRTVFSFAFTFKNEF